MDRICQLQSLVGLTPLSQGSPKITFSFPREMTWKVTLHAIPLTLRKRVEVKQICHIHARPSDPVCAHSWPNPDPYQVSPSDFASDLYCSPYRTSVHTASFLSYALSPFSWFTLHCIPMTLHHYYIIPHISLCHHSSSICLLHSPSLSTCSSYLSICSSILTSDPQSEHHSI